MKRFLSQRLTQPARRETARSLVRPSRRPIPAGLRVKTLETWVKYASSGGFEFNAIASRQGTILGVSFYGIIQFATTTNLESDPMSVSSVTKGETYSNGLWYELGIIPQRGQGGSGHNLWDDHEHCRVGHLSRC